VKYVKLFFEIQTYGIGNYFHKGIYFSFHFIEQLK